MGMFFRIGILFITYFGFYVATTKAQCGPGDICELHEWVQWDCKQCCKIGALPNSAVQKRKICCQGGAKTLTECLSFCNINLSEVERWGPCAYHCHGKCTNGFHFATTETHITSKKTTHAKETTTTYTSDSPTTTQQTTISVSTVRTSNPMTPSIFHIQNIQSTSDKNGTTEFQVTTSTTRSIQTTTEPETSIVSFTEHESSQTGTSVKPTEITYVKTPSSQKNVKDNWVTLVSPYASSASPPQHTASQQYINDTVTSDENRGNVSNPTNGINATTETVPNTTIDGLQKTNGKCDTEIYFPILLFVAGFLVGGLLTTTVFYLKNKKTRRISARRSSSRNCHQIPLNYEKDDTQLNGDNKPVKRGVENLAF